MEESEINVNVPFDCPDGSVQWATIVVQIGADYTEDDVVAAIDEAIEAFAAVRTAEENYRLEACTPQQVDGFYLWEIAPGGFGGGLEFFEF